MGIFSSFKDKFSRKNPAEHSSMSELRARSASLSSIICDNKSSPAFCETLAVESLKTICSLAENHSIFKNRYVCADAALIASFISEVTMIGDKFEEDAIFDMREKYIRGIIFLFDFTQEELNSIWSNRFHFYMHIFEKDKWTQQIMDETSFLFTYDLSYDKFVEFRSDSPLIITGIQEKIRTETETTDFFKKIFPVLIKCFDEYWGRNQS